MRSLIRATLMILALIILPGIIQANPPYKRLGNGKDIGAHGEPLNFAKFNDREIGLQMDGEFPGSIKQRQKRLSDQRRAELETLMALSKMTGKLVTVSRGGRQLDTAKIGRRRRSLFELNLKNLRKLFRLSGDLGQKGNAAYPLIS